MSVCLSLPQRSACCAPCRSDMARPLQGTAFIPSLLVVWSSTAFILSYVIAVLSGHVNPLVPYISDTGTNPPESGVFGFMISITAFLGAVTMYAKYKILEKQNEVSRFMNPLSNVASLTTGLMGCTGMGIVATFQDYAVHLTSAICEWIVAFAFICFFLTYIRDFQGVTLTVSTEILDDFR
ncbi:DNA damage-regulated autophagy modulator protein 1 isoform X3 [Microcaecilia unicolor]|uniref:DNA damage-regulated autophagy modulator protein 1 isoform X3 n=1 Tax=Microcaecilia unicolor TaxID=1415580 RepID=A0A6P7Z2F3_9AMPH|nr:DNA damage-regulated autophagy modulator protein 1 isoform X3 [Microcaecilia unicolor]